MVQTTGPEVVTLINAATAPVTANIPTLDMRGHYSLTLAVLGTFTGSVEFQATLEGAVWAPIELRRQDAKNQVGTSTTSESTWVNQDRFPLGAIRCRIPTLSSGSVTVKVMLQAESRLALALYRPAALCTVTGLT